MTKGEVPDSAFEHRSFGTPGAERAVVVLRAGAAALSDPRPDVTARRDVRIVAVGLTPDDMHDPSAYQGTTPAEATAQAIAQLVDSERQDRPVGLVGVAAAGEVAIMVASALGPAVDRLALVSVPRPDTELGAHAVGERLAALPAEALVMNGQADPAAGAAAARWHQEQLASARIEMVGGASGRSAELILGDVWERVLSHVAPGTGR